MDPEQDTAKPATLRAIAGVEVNMVDLRGNRIMHRILSPCDGISSGNWYCVTHDQHFATNDHKDVHCQKPGTHVLAWNCKQHGLEVP